MIARYVWKVLLHKWYVFIECCKLGIPWLGLLHDRSKLLPCELVPYARWFFGKDWMVTANDADSFLPGDTVALQCAPDIPFVVKRIDGYEVYLRTPDDKLAFDMAWNHHQKRNKHHWQYWVLIYDHPELKSEIILPMPPRYCKEMVADWEGAYRAYKSYKKVREWYLEHRDNMKLHPDTRAWIESRLEVTS